MTDGPNLNLPDTAADDRLEKAVEWFLRVRSEGAHPEDLSELQRWMEGDPHNAQAYQQVTATWNTLDAHASAPEIVVGRRDALEDSRRAARRRWSAKAASRLGWAIAASGLIAVMTASIGWFVAQRGDVYATDLGERRTVTLVDGSVLTLDARSRVRVRYTEAGRKVTLEEGQARFAVAKDLLRPFRVQAGDQTVVALGTQFDVELVAGAVLVTLIEGHIAVAGVDPQSMLQAGGGNVEDSARAPSEHGAVKPHRVRHEAGGTVELTAGEALRVRHDGRAVLVAKVDLDRATAWQSGRLFFDNEPLASAAERVNRYARRAIVVDPSVAQVGISGVFNAGDADAFVDAVTAYFPVHVEGSDKSEVRLTAGK